MTTQHSTRHLPVCASLPGRAISHHLRFVVALLPTCYHHNASCHRCGKNPAELLIKMLEGAMNTLATKDHVRAIESSMEIKVIADDLIDHDVAEKRELAELQETIELAMQEKRLDVLPRCYRLSKSLNARNIWEDDQHNQMPMHSRAIAWFLDRLPMRAVKSSPDAA